MSDTAEIRELIAESQGLIDPIIRSARIKENLGVRNGLLDIRLI
jgi:hypothetical protein